MKSAFRTSTQCIIGDVRGSSYVSHRGFTLLEVILVMLVFSVMAGLVINNMDGMMRAANVIPAETRFREIVREARLIAREQQVTVELSFQKESGRFVLKISDKASAGQDSSGLGMDAENGVEEDILFSGYSPSGEDYSYKDLTIEIYPILSATENDAVDAPPKAVDSIPALIFEPSGVSTPARVIFQYDGGETLTLTLDAFSSGPIFSRDEIPSN